MPLIISVILCNLHLSLVISQSPPICEYLTDQNRIVVVEVHCNGRNYTNFPLAKHLPENTSSIHFKDNNVQRLPNQPDHALRSKVWNIDLSGNIIDQLFAGQSWESIPKCFILGFIK